MSGHSKWSKIKRAKGAQDKKRGKIFTRCIHEITVAVREGGGPDPDGNPRLRIAIDKAKSNNMPGDNIERAISRAAGGGKDSDRFELVYEGYGPGGVAVLVEVLTDNKNRTVGEVRHAFSKCGGSLGENGCVSWMFQKKGLVLLPKVGIDEAHLIERALELGADDVSESDDFWEVTSEQSGFSSLREGLAQEFKIEEAEVQYLPSNRQEIAGKEADQMIRLLEMLEDLDDVMNVASNCEFPEDEGDTK